MGIAKEKMWTTQVCLVCLTWLYGLFVRSLVSLINEYADCGRPALNFIERYCACVHVSVSIAIVLRETETFL